MATIYLRGTLGRALTWTEADNNITNLNTAKLENVVEDTTPQLGGNLDVNGNSIVSTSNGNITISPNGTGTLICNTDVSTDNTSATYNLTAGGYTQTSDQLYTFSSVGADGTQSGSTPNRGLGVSNATSGARSVVYVRAHGQNESGGTSTTSGLAQLTLEGTRGTHTAPTALTTGNSFGIVSAGGYDGAKYTIADRGAGTAQIIFQADEAWANDGTYTTDAGTNVIMRIQPSNMRLTSNSRQNIFITDWDTAVTGSGPEQYILFGYPNSNTQYTNTGVQYTGTAKTNTQFINTALANIGVTGQDSAQFTADITGTTMTVTAVASGIISLGQRVYTNSDGTWGSVTQLTTITALGTGAGSTGTYTVSVSQTVASMTMYSGPDNHSLRYSNSIALVANRRNGLIGRRNKIKNNDIIHTIDFYGQTSNSSSSYGGKTATIAVTALEDFETTAYGSQFTVETVAPTTTTRSTRLTLQSTASTINTDSLTVENVAGTDILTLSTTSAQLTSDSVTLSSTNNGNISITPNGTGSVIIDGLSWPQTDGTADYVLKTNGSGQLSWTAQTSGGGITDIVQDTTPQLGGNLDVNSYSIVSASNGNISITPNGTGSVIIDGNTHPQTQGAAGEVLTADGSGLIEWKLNQTLSVQVYNADSVTINKGQPVYVFGSTGTNISVKLAVNTGDATSAQTLGLANEAITAGSTGVIICQGLLKNVDTSAYSAGQALYLGSTAGAITTTKPYEPNHLVYLGFVETVNASSGRIYVRTQNGYELDEIHDVNINHAVALANNHYLRYNSSSTRWENNSLDISHDTAPNLGGNLDVSGYSVVSTSNGNISITPNGTGKTVISSINYNEGAIYDLGTTGGTIAPNVTNGNVQKITLNSALTMNAFTSPVAGQSLTLIIYGGTAYTSITSTMKFAGGVKTLTGTASCIDILSVYYDGTTYFASLNKGFA